MSLPVSHVAKTALRSISASRCRLHFPQARTVSINSAIHKGVHRDTERRERRQPRFTRDGNQEGVHGRSSNVPPSYQRDSGRGRQYWENVQRERGGLRPNTSREEPRAQWGPRDDARIDEFRPSLARDSPGGRRQHEEQEERGRNELRSVPPAAGPRQHRGSRRDAQADGRPTGQSSYPLSVPHTTAASQFLYGYSTVYAALRAGRRQCYKLYLHTRGATRDDHVKEQDSLRRLAMQKKVKIVDGDLADVRLLDKMSEGRPHNGIVLEASPLPISNLLSLTNPVTDSETGRTSFAVLQAGSRSTTLTPLQKQPLLLLVDDVLDGGNLGAVLRSAYFLGVDAVLLTAHVAPLNAVALKASAGAAEALPIFRVDDPGSVLRKSKANGWHVLAATTPGQQDGFGTKGRKGLSPDAAPVTIPERNIRYHMPPARSEADITTRLGSTPQVLVIGGEGRGLRSFITKEADAFLEVLSPRQKSIAEVGLDSLNVSVAAAVALQEVLGRMRAGEVMKKESKKDAEKDTREDAGVAEVGDVESGDRMFTLSSDIGERLNELQEDEAPVEEVRASSG